MSAGVASAGLSQRRHHGDEEAPLPGATSQLDLLLRTEPSSSQAGAATFPVAAKPVPTSGMSDDPTARAVLLNDGDSKAGRDVAAQDGIEEDKPEPFVEVTYWDIAREFSIMGYIGFGGPAAHIGLFQKVRALSAAPPCMHVSHIARACGGRLCAMHTVCTAHAHG